MVYNIRYIRKVVKTLRNSKESLLNGVFRISGKEGEFSFEPNGKGVRKVQVRRMQMNALREVHAIEYPVSSLAELVRKMVEKVQAKDTSYLEGYVMVDTLGHILVPEAGKKGAVLWVKYAKGRLNIAYDLDDIDNEKTLQKIDVYKLLDKPVNKVTKQAMPVSRKSPTRLEYEHLEGIAASLGFVFDRARAPYKNAVLLLKECIVAMKLVYSTFPTTDFPAVKIISLKTMNGNAIGSTQNLGSLERLYKESVINLNKDISPKQVRNTIFHEYGHIIWYCIQYRKPVQTTMLKLLKRPDLAEDKFVRLIPRDVTDLKAYYHSKEYQNLGELQRYFLSIDEIGAHIIEYRLSKTFIEGWDMKNKICVRFTDGTIKQFFDMYIPLLTR